MRLILLKPYGMSPAGALLDVGLGVAEQLLARGIAKQEEELKAVAKPPENKSMASPDRKEKRKVKSWPTN